MLTPFLLIFACHLINQTEMKVYDTIDSFRDYRFANCKPQATLGLVATMGALHKGHLSLVQKAIAENQYVAVSIFVNPIQFNKASDLKSYPRTLDKDLALLDEIMRPDDMVFNPSVEEMYPETNHQEYDFGNLAAVMEGAKRPGHFNGVGIVVNKLFRIIEPTKAYFGEKDFQQLAIIRKLVEIESLPVEIIPCPIVRENDGLAMSSRNMRLDPDNRKLTPQIYRALTEAREHFMAGESTNTLSDRILNSLNTLPDIKVEYVTFADEHSLSPVGDIYYDATKKLQIRCFIAVYAGDVRLIDNLPMY